MSDPGDSDDIISPQQTLVVEDDHFSPFTPPPTSGEHSCSPFLPPDEADAGEADSSTQSTGQAATDPTSTDTPMSVGERVPAAFYSAQIYFIDDTLPPEGQAELLWWVRYILDLFLPMTSMLGIARPLGLVCPCVGEWSEF